MANLRETSKEYEPKKTLNIADLDIVSLDVPMDKVSGTNQEGKDFEYHVAEIEGEKYRVPVSVIQQLKVLLEDKPELKKFKVKKSGSTKDDTRYQVIPL